MANQLVLREFRAAIPGGAPVQVFRPGDVILDTDPNFLLIFAAATETSALAAYPLAPALATAATTAIEDRLRAVPDDVVSTNLLAAAASGGVP